MKKLYMLLGIIMVLIGFSISFLFLYSIINSTLLTATGLSITILGYTSIGLAYTRPHISPETKGIFLKTNNILLITLAVEFIIINGLLAFFKQNDLVIYLVIGVIAYFITLWFYIALKPKLRNALTAVAVAVFFEFMIVITYRIIGILK